jgi:hypothetical protein
VKKKSTAKPLPKWRGKPAEVHEIDPDRFIAVLVRWRCDDVIEITCVRETKTAALRAVRALWRKTVR